MELSHDLYYWLFWGLALLCAGLFYLRHKKRVRAFLLGSTTGLGSLVLLHVFGGAVGFTPSLCTANLVLCTVLGVPGTALLILGEAFL